MTFASVRRRIRNRFAGHDWLEALLLVLGLVLLAGSIASVYATVVLIAHFRDVETGFPAGPGVAQIAKGLGLLLFPLLAIVTFLAGSHLAGLRPGRILRRFRAGRRG